jgi:hypothetical protein
VKFLKPLKGVQVLDRTNWKSLNVSSVGYSKWAGAYFADPNQLNTSSGKAVVNEFTPCVLNFNTGTLTWDIPHFSGYMISVGGEE